jgi:transposase-like protein
MHSLNEQQIDCPYCGETLSIVIDPSAGNQQQYIEDCHVCCRPIQINTFSDSSGELYVSAQPENI